MALLPVASRYAALGGQLLLFVLVTHFFTQADAGRYFVFLGVVTVSSCLFGLGLPDGFVRFIPEIRAHAERKNVREALKRGFSYSIVTSSPALAILALYGRHMGQGNVIGLGLVLWWLSYGVVYFCSQALVSVGRQGLGSFLFYTGANILTFLALAAYVALARDPGLQGAVVTTALAATATAAISMAALRQSSALPTDGSRISLKEVSSVGASIVAGRVLQGLLFWIPVWTVAHAFSARDAAVFAIASRLLFGVMGALAAVRFSVRPTIVSAVATDRWGDIQQDSARIALIATGLVVAAIVGDLAVGQPILGFAFGAQYRGAAAILLVLLIGGLAESFGGPVDEVLKMSGGQHVALVAIGGAVLIEAALALICASFGLLWVAAAQATAFWLLYGFYVLYVLARRGVLISPLGAKWKVMAPARSTEQLWLD